MFHRNSGSVFVATVVLASFSFVGCGGKSESSTPVAEIAADIAEVTKGGNVVPGEAAPTVTFVAASQSQTEALIKSIEAAIAHQDAAAFSALIDEEQIISRILQGLNISEESRNGFAESMRSRDGMSSVSSEIMNAVQTGGDYHFVRIQQKGNEFHPLFRLTLPNSGGLNYHELIVSQDANGQPRIAEIEVFLSGEPVTQSLRRLVLPAFVAENTTIRESLKGTEAEYIANISTFERINELMSSQKFEQAMRHYTTLPATLQSDKASLMVKLSIAQQVSDEAYLNVIRELDTKFPDEPSRDLRARDMHSIQGKHEDAVKAIDRLIASIQDPYLSLLKVDSLIALNRMDEAQKAAAESKAASPDRIDAYWVEIGMLLKLKDHAATAKSLDEVADKFGIKFFDLKTVPEYAEFVASQQGKEWMTRHPPDSETHGPPSSVPSVPEVPPAAAVPDVPK